MHILAVGKSLCQSSVFREVGHDAQLDLRVVGRNDAGAGRRDEGRTNASPLGRADRNVLQIGVAGGEPAGDGDGLCVAGMHATGLCIDHLRQLVGVGALELGELARFEQQFRQRVIERQFGEHLFVGRRRARRCLFLDRQAKLVEQNFGQLFRRIDIERLASEFMGLLFEFEQALAQLLALLCEQG